MLRFNKMRRSIRIGDTTFEANKCRSCTIPTAGLYIYFMMRKSDQKLNYVFEIEQIQAILTK